MIVLIQILWARQNPFMLLGLVITLLLGVLMAVQGIGPTAVVTMKDVHFMTIGMVALAVPVLPMTTGLLTAVATHLCRHLLPLGGMIGTMIVTTGVCTEGTGMTLVTVANMTVTTPTTTIAITTGALTLEDYQSNVTGIMIGTPLADMNPDLLMNRRSPPRVASLVMAGAILTLVLQSTTALHIQKSILLSTMINLHLLVILLPRILLLLLHLPKNMLLLLKRPQKQ